MSEAFWAGGLRFGCTGCGDCCRARAGWGPVYVTADDRRRLARFLGLPMATFTRRFCERQDGALMLREPARDCVFLAPDGCAVYGARPAQCRTWPFWPENLNARAWARIARDCPGIGRGRRYSAAEIRRRLASGL